MATIDAYISNSNDLDLPSPSPLDWLPVNLMQRNYTISLSGVKYFVLSKFYQLTKQNI